METFQLQKSSQIFCLKITCPWGQVRKFWDSTAPLLIKTIFNYLWGFIFICFRDYVCLFKNKKAMSSIKWSFDRMACSNRATWTSWAPGGSLWVHKHCSFGHRPFTYSCAHQVSTVMSLCRKHGKQNKTNMVLLPWACTPGSMNKQDDTIRKQDTAGQERI